MEKRFNSRTSPGAEAPFEEALSILVNEYPGKDKILLGSGGGSGSAGSKGAPKPGKILASDAMKLGLNEFEKQDKAGNIVAG